MAADIADGLTAEVVSRFHRAVLSVGASPDIARELFSRIDRIYGPVLPGYGGATDQRERVPFVIGPEKQLRSYENYLKSAEGATTELNRLYPRDYWQLAPGAPSPSSASALPAAH
jgi:hypothetical protein